MVWFHSSVHACNLTARSRADRLRRPLNANVRALMRIILAIAFCTLIAATLPPAYADWTLVGAAAKCDEKEGLTIAATVDGSEGIFKVPPEEGFHSLPDGENKIECTMGGALVSASIVVFPPSAAHCMGSGIVMMKRFDIGTVPVVQAHTPFLW